MRRNEAKNICLSFLFIGHHAQINAQTIHFNEINKLYFTISYNLLKPLNPLDSFVNKESEMFFLSATVNSLGLIESLSISSEVSDKNIFSNILKNNLTTEDFNQWKCTDCAGSIIIIPILIISKYKSDLINRMNISIVGHERLKIVGQLNNIIYLSPFLYKGTTIEF